MHLLKFNLFVTMLMMGVGVIHAQKVDYSVVNAVEETGIDFMQVTTANDFVCMPVVKRTRNSLSWLSNRILDVSVDGKYIAYISARNNTTNIFIKELGKQGGSIQRTKRQAVLDFSYSPDGKTILFSEARGVTNQVFQTDASAGYVCRMITSASQDFSPIYTKDMSKILFARMENNGVGVWGYDLKSNFLSSYTVGMNPYPLKGDACLCVRTSADGHSEIWRVNYSTGVEECVISDPNRSFTSPVLS
ncbi:MAG: PD40 domain-containing protein, partial [Bacteroidaceae bacterium]|nr:PD40 domain-containing protein [Bacteroidaceae bacterium]